MKLLRVPIQHTQSLIEWRNAVNKTTETNKKNENETATPHVCSARRPYNNKEKWGNMNYSTNLTYIYTHQHRISTLSLDLLSTYIFFYSSGM